MTAQLQAKFNQMAAMREEAKPPERHQTGVPAFCATMAGGLIALFVNIPLTSPDDRLANTGSVAVLSLFLSLILSRIWSGLRGELKERTRLFSRIWTALFVAVVGGALLLEMFAEVSNTARYVLPLTAVVCAASVALSPVLERSVGSSALFKSALILAIGVVLFGVVLAYLEVGFTEPPSLSLPPPP